MSNNPVFIEKLHLRNFRSVRSETITFDNPLFLVGRNGSGKSNLLDALAFLSECMVAPMQTVVNRRGSVYSTLYRSRLDQGWEMSGPTELSLRVDFRLGGSGKKGLNGHYVFFAGLGTQEHTLVLAIKREQCFVSDGVDSGLHWFDRTARRFRTSVSGVRPALDPLALALPIIGGVEEFAPVLKALGALRVYAIEPNRIREAREPDTGLVLNRDGSNVASVLLRLERLDKGVPARLGEILGVVTPGIKHVEAGLVGNQIVLTFLQDRAKGGRAIFNASAMSDGTLRLLGLAIATMQNPAPPFLAIEEPENNIHPGALGVIEDLIEATARRTQIIVTTHSPDLLDAKWIQAKNIRVVTWEDDATRVSPLGEVPVKALRTHLMGAGELLRANALDPEEPGPTPTSEADDLFEPVPA